MIVTAKLVKIFGHVKALDGVDLKVERGEFLTIFGPNGAGKTTLIKILTSQSKPTSGKVILSGMELKAVNRKKVRSIIGVISHSSFLYDDLTGYENLQFFASMYDVKKDPAYLEGLLEDFGLGDRMDDTVRTYSRGMQQRLSIARALVHKPEIIFMDEPYTGLDHQAIELLQKILSDIHSEGRTIIMVTHNLPRGLELSERVAIISSGRMTWSGLSKEINREEFESLYLKAVASTKA